MHEASIMSGLIGSVLEELRKYKISKVEEVNLTVGELTYLGDEQLEFAFEVLSRGTIMEGSKLVIEHEQVEVKCSHCGYEGEAEHIEDEMYHTCIPTLTCPKCSERVEVKKGKICMINVKVVEEDVPVQG